MPREAQERRHGYRLTSQITRVTRGQHCYEVRPDVSPALEINPFQRVMVETMDCFSGAITDSSQRFNNITDLLAVVPDINPVSGPIAVKGPEPGDVLAVRGLDIRVGMDGGRRGRYFDRVND